MSLLRRLARRRPGRQHQLGSEDTESVPRPTSEVPVAAPACKAPFGSMYLDPRGQVLACCMNHYQPLGNITEQSLTEIWRGDAAQRLRFRLAEHDLSLGCELCAVKVDAGSEDAAYLHVFDHLELDGARPEWPSQLELALSNSCNLQCVMCNGDLSSSIRIHREGRAALPVVYDDAFFEALDEFLPHLRNITFLGGEPFLGREPLRVMERLVERGLRPSCHVTTNGTQWNARVAKILRAIPMHVAISVDGLSPETLGSVRVGADPEQVMSNVLEIRDAARAGGGGCSLAFCLMRPTWAEFADYLVWADSVDLDVFVNTVTYPPQFSLAHLADDELDEVVQGLRAEDDRLRSVLVRNLDVWTRTLDDVTHMHLERRSGSGPDVGPEPVPVQLRTTVDQRARRICDAASDRGVVMVGTDRFQIIDRVVPDPADALGMDLRPYLGASIADLVEPLLATFGATESTHLTQHEDGLEQRTTVLSRGFSTTTVTAVLVAGASGDQRWYLGARGAPG
jgi:radical SAM protein with 4Fe4S-binding SPASM domain